MSDAVEHQLSQGTTHNAGTTKRGAAWLGADGFRFQNWRMDKTRRATSWDSPVARGKPSELWAKGRPGGVRDQKRGRARDHGERYSPVSGRTLQGGRARTTANDTAREPAA